MIGMVQSHCFIGAIVAVVVLFFGVWSDSLGIALTTAVVVTIGRHCMIEVNCTEQLQ
jgi:hypothetical protein